MPEETGAAEAIPVDATAAERRKISNREAQQRFRNKRKDERMYKQAMLSSQPQEGLMDLALDLSQPSSAYGNSQAIPMPLWPGSHFSSIEDGIHDNFLMPTPTTLQTHQIVGSQRNGEDDNVPSQEGPSSTEVFDVPPEYAESYAEVEFVSTLHLAAHYGRAHIATLILQHAWSSDVNQEDSNGRTALYAAALNGHVDVVRVLLSYGAHVEKGDKMGRTALIAAAFSENEEILRLVLEQSPGTINARDNHGWSALDVCVYKGWEAGLVILMNAGADLGTRVQKCQKWKKQELEAQTRTSLRV